MRTKPGSPPRGRGKVDIDLFGFLCRGITPAWAGKRSWKHDHVRKHGDHPRVGGEKSFIYQFPFFRRGSPPRGRGKAQFAEDVVVAVRITPAWAGKSGWERSPDPRRGDHPRVGGEKSTGLRVSDVLEGSPPRGRGKVNFCPILWFQLRITPAWAGKRLKRSHRSGIFISGPIPFHSVLHRPAGSGGSRAGRDGSPAGQPQNTGPA